MQTIKIRLLPWRAVGMVGAALFGLCIVGSLTTGQAIVAPFFLPFFIPSLYLFYCFGHLEIDAEGIRNVAASGTYELRWQDITEAEFAQSQMVFKGHKQRLVIPKPIYWNPKDRKPGMDALQAFFSASGVVPQERSSADFKITKIRKNAN